MVIKENTPGTRGWSRLCDRMLAVKSRKNAQKTDFFHLKSFFTKADFCFSPSAGIHRILTIIFLLITFFGDFSAFYGQHSVAEPGPTPIPWSIALNMKLKLSLMSDMFIVSIKL